MQTELNQFEASTFLEIIECTVARPSRTININLELGNISAKYVADFNVNGSLLHSRGEGSPCRAIISRQNAATAASKT